MLSGRAGWRFNSPRSDLGFYQWNGIIMKSSCRLEKHTWKSARELILPVYPQLAQAIDEISPGDKYPLYRASYPYGAMILDKEVFFVPNREGDIVPIYDPS